MLLLNFLLVLAFSHVEDFPKASDKSADRHKCDKEECYVILNSLMKASGQATSHKEHCDIDTDGRDSVKDEVYLGLFQLESLLFDYFR